MDNFGHFIPLDREALMRHNANRVILHIDANCFYASCECLYNPDIRNKPVAVGGDPEARHGIILTKNYIAKKYGIQTGEALWQARQKCPELIIIPAHYDLYFKFSRKLRKLYSEYSDKVQSYGLDECWCDMSGYCGDLSEGALLADQIRERVKEELGITVSVGVANNMALAKLGSDMKKPDGTTFIHPERLHERVWKLPVGDLLFCGAKTSRKLTDVNLRTIGDLARSDERALYQYAGLQGQMLQKYALGLDDEEVRDSDADLREKSIGNSTTPPRDLVTPDDVRAIIYLLAENIAFRLRKGNWLTRTVCLSVRSTVLITTACQKTVDTPTNLTSDIANAALALFYEHYEDWLPFRSLGIQCTNLIPGTASEQLSFFDVPEKCNRAMKLEDTLDGLRLRFGNGVIHRGIVYSDSLFSGVAVNTNIGPAAQKIPS